MTTWRKRRAAAHHPAAEQFRWGPPVSLSITLWLSPPFGESGSPLAFSVTLGAYRSIEIEDEVRVISRAGHLDIEWIVGREFLNRNRER